MAHVLILGMTESGKTTLARGLAHEYKKRGAGTLVLDPLNDPRWQSDYITDDQELFLEVFWKSQRCYAFLDEGGESVGRYNESMQKCATRGRHWGHSCHFIAQRAMQLAPIVRDQCTHLFLFCSSYRDGKILSEEWNRPELEKCTELRQGEYIHAVKFGLISTHNMRGKSDESHSSDRRAGGDGGRADDARQEEGGDRTSGREVNPDSPRREGGEHQTGGGK